MPLPNQVMLFVSLFTNGHRGGAEIGNELTLSVAKKLALFIPPRPVSNSATSDRRINDK